MRGLHIVYHLKCAIVYAIFLLTAFAGASQASAQQERLALVVGQSAYEGRQLATAANDAGLIAQALTSAGFEVIQGRDLSANDLRSIVRDFLDKAQDLPEDSAVAIYLSGYGLQLEGENYLLPVDARIQRDTDIPIDGFRLSDLVRALEGTPARTRIVIADMTRDFPLPSGSEPLARGLALMEPPAGFLIAFSSAPNITNGDAPGPYGHYATALAEMMRQPGVPVDEMFNRVRLRTHETTQGLQTPWHKANLGDVTFTFFEPEESAAIPPPVREVRRIEEVPAEEAYAIAVERDTISDYQAFLRRYPDHPLARRVSALLAARREAIVWRQTVSRNTREAYWTYLRRYPNGPHAGDCRRRLARLSAPPAPPQVFEEIVYEDLPPPLPVVERIQVVEVVTIIREAPPPPPPPVYLLPAYEEDVEFVTIIREPPPPPVMVGVLPIPAPMPLPRYARAPRAYYEPIAPVTPRGPVIIPVAPPRFRDAPRRGPDARPGPQRPRPAPVVPRQPGLRAEPKPIPVVSRPPATVRQGAPTPRVEGRPRLPSRAIPLNPREPRPASVSPAVTRETAPVAASSAVRPSAPVARPAARARVPQDTDRDPVAQPRQATPQPSRQPAAQPSRQASPAAAAPQRVTPVRPDVARPAARDDEPVRRITPAKPQSRPAPRAAAPEPARPSRPAPAPQVREKPRPAPVVPQVRERPRSVPSQANRPSAPARVERPQPVRPSAPPAARPTPNARPQAVRPATPAASPKPVQRCVPGKPCITRN